MSFKSLKAFSALLDKSLSNSRQKEHLDELLEVIPQRYEEYFDQLQNNRTPDSREFNLFSIIHDSSSHSARDWQLPVMSRPSNLTMNRAFTPTSLSTPMALKPKMWTEEMEDPQHPQVSSSGVQNSTGFSYRPRKAQSSPIRNLTDSNKFSRPARRLQDTLSYAASIDDDKRRRTYVSKNKTSCWHSLVFGFIVAIILSFIYHFFLSHLFAWPTARLSPSHLISNQLTPKVHFNETVSSTGESIEIAPPSPISAYSTPMSEYEQLTQQFTAEQKRLHAQLQQLTEQLQMLQEQNQQEQLSASTRYDIALTELRQQVQLNANTLKTLMELPMESRSLAAAQSGHQTPVDMRQECDSLINDRLAVFDADKVAEANFASALSGARIMESSPSSPFVYDRYFLFGYELRWREYSRAYALIDPLPVHQRQGWFMEGHRGSVRISLRYPVLAQTFIYEHLPANLALSDERRACMPKVIHVLGFVPTLQEWAILGKMELPSLNSAQMPIYRLPLNRPLKHKRPMPIQQLKLEIDGNHGNLYHTCLYKVRLTGTLIN